MIVIPVDRINDTVDKENSLFFSKGISIFYRASLFLNKHFTLQQTKVLDLIMLHPLSALDVIVFNGHPSVCNTEVSFFILKPPKGLLLKSDSEN
jgi:hypothetical protein